ncbi:SRPBCC family protein [Nocardia concava]|uniref:SRPBCC family protein n=1 Tax=Nocardia concava TaxID=257281 RepID=UPI0002F65066|nr:SRPBCC domain-containing protein [Nocardia concava]
MSDRIRIEHDYPTTAQTIWDLWTTAAGIEKWWAPDGFTVHVDRLDLRPGGELVYTMTATAPEQIEFMRSVGMPLSTESRKTFTEVDGPNRLAYTSLADFIPGVEPYEFLTTVDLEPTDAGVRVVMTVDAMHDDVWTERLQQGRANELANLAAVVSGDPSENH